MKKIISIFVLLLTSVKFCYGQNEQYVHKNFPAHLIETRQMIGEDNIKHTDSLAGYKITIPQWWKIKETSSRNILSGIFPETKGIVNAMSLKVNLKSDFENFDDFKSVVITKYEIGDSMKWSNEHTLLKKERSDKYLELGESYYVEFEWINKTYCCYYILIETSNTYLWIDFTATKETFDINFPKFQELIKSLEIL